MPRNADRSYLEVCGASRKVESSFEVGQQIFKATGSHVNKLTIMSEV